MGAGPGSEKAGREPLLRSGGVASLGEGADERGARLRVGETAGLGSPKGAGTDYESEKGEEPNSKKEARSYSG